MWFLHYPSNRGETTPWELISSHVNICVHQESRAHARSSTRGTFIGGLVMKVLRAEKHLRGGKVTQSVATVGTSYGPLAPDG